jgi:hypothetical protein
MAEPKKVALYTISPFKHDGKHVALDTVVQDVEPELAKELAGAGRTRLATPEEVAAAHKQRGTKSLATAQA